MGDITQNVTVLQPVRHLESAQSGAALWEPTLFDDISRLRRDVDRLTRSNRLGHSSLKLGEGSLDVHNDEGTPVAGVGETPAGHGISIADPDNIGKLVGVPVLIERRNNEVKTGIRNEHEARISAVQSEASTRAAQDKNLSDRITNETAARQSADSSLGTRITNLTSARNSAVSSSQSKINNEQSAWNSNKASANTQLAAQEIRLAFLEANSGGGGNPPPFTP